MTEVPFLYNLNLVENDVFSPRQNEIIKLIIKGIGSHIKIANYLGIKPGTVKNHISGTFTGFEEPSRTRYGIFGVIENSYGRRPTSLPDLIWILGQNGLVIQEKSNPHTLAESEKL